MARPKSPYIVAKGFKLSEAQDQKLRILAAQLGTDQASVLRTALEILWNTGNRNSES